MAAIRTPSKKQIAELAQSDDRFAVMAAITPRVPLGTRRCCDVRQIGPARQKALKFSVSDWDHCVGAREPSSVKKLSRCNGVFFSAFGKKQSTRQCDLAASANGFCSSCDAMRKASKKNIILSKAEYEVVTMAVYSRPGIKECSGLWEEEADKTSKDFKCSVQYPFFSAREILDMILMEGMVIFEEGGRSGTSYPRSACIIQAQNEHVQACMKSVLGILIFEKRQQFRKRWDNIIKAARSIHEYLQYLRADDDSTGNMGILQASDVIREELARACQVCKLKKCPARHLSLPIQRLVDWVVNARMMQCQPSSSPESVKTPASSSMKTPHPSRKGETPQLSMQKVPRMQSNKKQSEVEDKRVSDKQTQSHISLQDKMKEFSVPAPVKTIIQESTIAGAGQGLFLVEPAKDKQMVGRYSGKVLSASQAKKSRSKYLLRINKNLFIDAEQEGHLEGRKLNCARKAGRKANVRFRSTLTVNYCAKTGIAWIPFYAVGDILPTAGSPVELLADYGELFWSAEGDQQQIILSQIASEDASEDHDASAADVDHESDEDFVPPTSTAVPAMPSTQRRVTRSMRKQTSERDDLVWENAHGEKLDSKGGASLNDHHNRLNKSDPATKLQFSSPSNSDSSRTKTDSQTTGKEVYAVAIGRCIGLFLSAERMQQSLWHYPRSKFKICDSMEQAEAYLAMFSIPDPRRYWTEVFEDGSLLMNPHRVINFRVCFPVGLLHDFYQPPHGFGTVVSTSLKDNMRSWSVRMDAGFMDHYVQEWPLLCALEKARAVMGPAAAIPVVRFHAARGIPRPAIFESEADVPQSIRHDRSKYRIFESRAEAQKWIDHEEASMFFAVRGSDNDGVDSDIQLASLRMNDQSEMRTFASRERALTWIQEMDEKYFALRGTESDGVFAHRADVLARFKGDYAEFQRFSTNEQARRWVDDGQCFIKCMPGEYPTVVRKDSLFIAKTNSPMAQFRGPFSAPSAYAMQAMLSATSKAASKKNHASDKSTPEENVNSAQKQCIAQLDDGSKCGRTASIQQTSIGWLCGWHAPSVQKAPQSRKDKASANVSEGEPSQTAVEASPVEGIRLPSGEATLKKEKANRFVVFAVRTFADSEAPTQPAGSIWLSSADAEAANMQGGRMKMFNSDDGEQQDIFENIANAQSWIEDQVKSKNEDSQSEFDRRLKESRSKMHAGESKGGRGGKGRKRGMRSRRGGGRGSKGGKKYRRGSRSREHSSEPSDCDHAGDDSKEESSDHDDEKSSTSSKRGASSRNPFQELMAGLKSRGGLRSGAARLLDSRQKIIEESLFYEDACEVEFHYTSCPPPGLISRLPNPGEVQAMSRTGKSKTVPKLTFDNKMQAVLAEKKFKAFPAFSLSDLMEFQQSVEHVAAFQTTEEDEATSSVLQAIRLICSIAIRVHREMRDAGELGRNGENFRAFTYLYVQFLVMFRMVYAGGSAEQYFWNRAIKYAPKVRGCPGMSPWSSATDDDKKSTASTGRKSDRCLVCGKPGHRSDSELHQAQLAEGSGAYSESEMKKALNYIKQDSSLSADKKKEWCGRTKAFWAALKVTDRCVEAP